MRGPLYGHSDHNMLETFTQAAKIAHLDHSFGNWVAAATSLPAVIAQPDTVHGRLGPVRPAELIVRVGSAG